MSLGNDAGARHRFTALGDARHQCDFRPESHPTQPAAEYTFSHTLTAEVAISRQRKLHTFASAAGQAAKQVAGLGAARHFGQQVWQVGGSAVGVYQGGVGFKAQA